MAADLQKAIVAAFSDKGLVKKIAEGLVEVLMPKILEHLKDLNLFNGEFCEEFTDYKKKHEIINRKSNMEIARKLDQIEQYERLDAVRVYGLEESEEEDAGDLVAKFFTKELKVKVSKQDINIAHRLGPVSADSKPRPMIVKFLRREQRLQVLRSRKSLKGRANLAISPDLTRPRAFLLKSLSANTTTWADFNGRIFREPNAAEKRQRLKKIEVFPEKFPAIFEQDQVDFRAAV